MWHVTCDTWRVIHDIWHMVGGEHSQNFSSPAFTVWDGQSLEDSELKDHSINEWMNHEGVYRTAPAPIPHTQLYCKESPAELMLLAFVWDETASRTARSKTENGLHSWSTPHFLYRTRLPLGQQGAKPLCCSTLSQRQFCLLLKQGAN